MPGAPCLVRGLAGPLSGLVLLTGIAPLLAACGSEAQSPTGATEGTGAGGTGGSGAGGSGTGAGTASTGNGGTGGQAGGTTGTTDTSTTETTTSAPPVLRIIAMGDGGEGNDTQYKVAAAVKSLCDAKGGCDFALYLGDNIYNSGASDPGDSQFQTKFEAPYLDLDFRFYVALGNHDYGGNGAGFEFWKAEAQVEYSAVSMKWTMPERFYFFSTPADAGPAGGPVATFFGLDTNAIMWTGDSDQLAWLQNEIAASPAGWKIGFGHHPYVSNGQHGNAGEYEGIPGIPVTSGKSVKDFMDDGICGKVDIYLSGHDHNRQWLKPTCGTEFIVTGTAAKTTDLVGQGTPTFFETDQKGGFLYIELTPEAFTGTFYDEDGVEEFTRTVPK
ncbi:MAG: metallophosphoesterase [Polyangiaceae bacterium]